MTKSRQYLSGIHLRAATMFLDKAKEVQEAGNGGLPNTRDHTALAAYSSATIMHSVAFMEANVNEHFLDIIDGGHPRGFQVPPDKKAAVESTWKTIHKNGPPGVLQKYRRALSAFGKSAQDLPDQTAAQALIHLRNALVHHKPEYIVDSASSLGNENRMDGLELLTRYVKRNPWYEGAHSGTTVALLGYDTARWSLETAVEFTQGFHSLVGVTSPMHAVRSGVRKKVDHD